MKAEVLTKNLLEKEQNSRPTKANFFPQKLKKTISMHTRRCYILPVYRGLNSCLQRRLTRTQSEDQVPNWQILINKPAAFVLKLLSN